MRACTEFIWLKEWLVVGHCEHSNEFSTSTSMNHIKFPNCLKLYQLLRFYLVRLRIHSVSGRLSLTDSSNFMPISSSWLRFWPLHLACTSFIQKTLGSISCSQHTQVVSLTPHSSAISNISVSELPASSLCLVSSCPLLALHSWDSPWSPQSCHMSIVHPCVAPAEWWPLGIALLCSPGTADLQNKVHHTEVDIFLKLKLEAL